MNRETVNMVRSPISVEGNIRLVPYYPAYDTALAWYQDAQLCKQVDNRDFVYDLPLLKRMYHYLDTHGELFYIEYRGVLCGDVSLRTTGELAIVICKEYQNKHIGRKVIEKMLELARERGLAECFAHIYSFNTQSQKMFESIGFVPQDEERYIYKLQKGEPTMTKLTLEEKHRLCRFFLDGNGFSVLIKIDHSETLRIVDVITKNGCLSLLCILCGVAQNFSESVSIENVIPEYHGTGILSDKFLSK